MSATPGAQNLILSIVLECILFAKQPEFIPSSGCFSYCFLLIERVVNVNVRNFPRSSVQLRASSM